MEAAQDAPEPEGAGFPELNELGRRLEVLRIQRGISKQHLARFAETSRQQLWRVMTGKTELTAALRERLAQALGVAPGELVAPLLAQSGVPRSEVPTSSAGSAPTASMSLGSAPATVSWTSGGTLAEYVADPTHLLRTMASLPRGGDGLRLKRQLLNAVEDAALERSVVLPAAFFEVRRQVLAGEL